MHVIPNQHFVSFKSEHYYWVQNSKYQIQTKEISLNTPHNDTHYPIQKLIDTFGFGAASRR